MPETKKPSYAGMVAVVGLTVGDDRYEPGDSVPAALIAEHPWLAERGKVEKKRRVKSGD